MSLARADDEEEPAGSQIDVVAAFGVDVRVVDPVEQRARISRAPVRDRHRRYVVQAVDEEAPALSPEEEAGIDAALESYRQGRVVDAKRAREIIDAALGH